MGGVHITKGASGSDPNHPGVTHTSATRVYARGLRHYRPHVSDPDTRIIAPFLFFAFIAASRSAHFMGGAAAAAAPASSASLSAAAAAEASSAQSISSSRRCFGRSPARGRAENCRGTFHTNRDKCLCTASVGDGKAWAYKMIVLF